MEILKHGSIGFDVLILRFRLDLWPSIYFDDDTTEAVKEFQKARKLKVDGEVGPLTRKALDLRSDVTPVPINLNKLWLAIALGELDERAWPGETVNSARILEYHQATKLKATTDEIAWCSSFVNWVITESGRVGTNEALAKSWLDWKHGDKVTNPEPGDVIIVRTVEDDKADPDGNGIKGYHVGFYISGDKLQVRILGGNQGGKVSDTSFPFAGQRRHCRERLPPPQVLRHDSLYEVRKYRRQRHRQGLRRLDED